MGLEGQVKLGFRRELAAIADEGERDARFRELVQSLYERGGHALRALLSIDDVIDPAATRIGSSRACCRTRPAAGPAAPKAGGSTPGRDRRTS